MKTFQIHINGLVQGVGFRPHVLRLAREAGFLGWVSNAKDGLHIEINASEEEANAFCKKVIDASPPNAVVTGYKVKPAAPVSFTDFTVKQDDDPTVPDLLLTPDFGLCESCRDEILNAGNRRFHYPFTTCLRCGPRYSIVKKLPYERHHTTMAPYKMCVDCHHEYHNPADGRYFSQTNSCPDCAITMFMRDKTGKMLSAEPETILNTILQELTEGSIIAVKGIGGYLLLCDATRKATIATLRSRKHRPAKPFALLYADVNMARKDAWINDDEARAMLSPACPIVLCKTHTEVQNGICTEVIAPGLQRIGLMLPSSPLLLLIAAGFGKPLVATSANISGSPIIYRDQDALELLCGIADFVVGFEREIVVPQDDSVLQFTSFGNKIILRRSRGLSPGYYPNPLKSTGKCLLAMGADLKSAFAIQNREKLYISQYLGNQECLASQTAFNTTLSHLSQLLRIKPEVLLADKHPGYYTSQYAHELSLLENIPLIFVQHHHAHFGAVLAENDLLESAFPVLGVIWDGTGFGDNKQLWGSEFFVSNKGEVHRLASLDYFPQLLGEKMSREPRLSALSLLKSNPKRLAFLQSRFTVAEWKYYLQLIRQPAALLTSSMGRFLDGIAAILGICDVNSYEGEAAMKLEACAGTFDGMPAGCYSMPLQNGRLNHAVFLEELFDDLNRQIAVDFIAKKVFYSLAVAIGRVSDYYSIHQLAFSGGVFQNALLSDLIIEVLGNKKKLYWHRQLSPNDECIGFGQLACYQSLQQYRTVSSAKTSMVLN